MDALETGRARIECRQTSAHSGVGARECVGGKVGHIHHQDAHLALHLADLLQDRQQSHANSFPAVALVRLDGRARTPLQHQHDGARTYRGAMERFVDALIGFEHG